MAEEKDGKTADPKKTVPLPTAYGVPVSELTSKDFSRRKLMDACNNCSNVKAALKRHNEPRFLNAFLKSGACAVVECPVNQVPKEKRA
jgi:hypothetical protein